MRLIFVRHAETTANAEGRFQGVLEYELSEAGLAQARRLRQRFDRQGLLPTHVYSSPQKRCIQTVEVLAQGWAAPVVYWDALREHDVGIFSGLTWDEIAARYPDVAQEFRRTRLWDMVEGAESLRSRRDRARRVIRAILGRHANGDTVLVVTHGGILQYMLSALMGAGRTWGMTVLNTAVFDFTLDVERWPLDGVTRLNNALWRINAFNDASHLAS